MEWNTNCLSKQKSAAGAEAALNINAINNYDLLHRPAPLPLATTSERQREHYSHHTTTEQEDDEEAVAADTCDAAGQLMTF